MKNHLANQAEQQQALDAKTRALRDRFSVPLEKDQATAPADLRAASRKASAELNDGRRALHQVNPPTQTQAGHQETPATLRQRDEVVRAALAAMISGSLRLGEDEEEKKRRRARELSGSIILKALTRVVASNGVITYSLHGRAVVRDEGQHLAVLDPNSDEVIETALLLGYEKFGTNLSLTGPPEFQRRAVSVAVNRGLPIKFIDPQLEAIRLQLQSLALEVPATPVLLQTPLELLRARVQAIYPDAKFVTPLDTGNRVGYFGKVVASLGEAEPGFAQFSTKLDAFILHPTLIAPAHGPDDLIEVWYKNGQGMANNSRGQGKGGLGD